MNRFWKGYDYVFYRTYLHYKKNRQKWYYRFFVKQDEEHGFQTFFVGIIVAHLAFIFLGIYTEILMACPIGLLGLCYCQFYFLWLLYLPYDIIMTIILKL